MHRILVLMSILAMPFSAVAQEAVPLTRESPEVIERVLAPNINIDDLKWIARPIFVFADSPDDPRVGQQLDMLEESAAKLIERDVVLVVDTDPSDNSSVRESLRPHGFAIVVMAKDGAVILRKASPRSVREITRVIDNQPLRQQEIRDRRVPPE